MNENPQSKLSQLAMDPAARQRSSGTMTLIFIVVGLAAVAAVLAWKPWAKEGQRFVTGSGSTEERGERGAITTRRSRPEGQQRGNQCRPCDCRNQE